jgi:3-deoxy-manno-octulosonate cytidylyltransferase (CMP-KDO synthetase)
MASTAILIPARYNSTRLPGKPTIELDGVPMIRRVYDACAATDMHVYALTDDQRVVDALQDGIEYRSCVLDPTDYANGTERCAAAVTNGIEPHLLDFEHIINVQGDMPDVTPDMIYAIMELLDAGADVATVYTDMNEVSRTNLNVVKMIKGTSNAQWFGRGFANYGYHHLGIYGYKRKSLSLYPYLKTTLEEKVEQLEQLRWLKNGWQIKVASVQYKGTEINTHEDVETWHRIHSQ